MRIGVFAITIALFPWPGVATAREHGTHVLVLNSYQAELSWTQRMMDGVREGLPSDAELFVEYMDTKRFLSPQYFEVLHGVYAFKYAGEHFDVIVATDDNAFQFLRTYHDSLFPGVPVVFCGVNNFDRSMLVGHPEFTGVQERVYQNKTIDLALRLHPEAKQVIVITDATTSGRVNRVLLGNLAARYRGTPFLFFDDKMHLTLDSLIDSLQHVKTPSIVYYSDFFRDANGEFLPYEDSIPKLSAACPFPIYAAGDMYLGLGIVGGHLVSSYEQGRLAGRMAARVLEGESPGDIPVVAESPNRYMFDYRQLDRFGIALDELPADSVIVNVPDTFYHRHRTVILAIAVFVIFQSVIIGGLTYSIIRRHRAEEALRESESRYRLLAENATDMIARFSAEGRILYVSPAVKRALGYAPAERVGKSAFDLAHPQDVGRLKEAQRQLRAAPGEVTIECRLRGNDGSYRWIETTMRSIFDESGKQLEIVAVSRDVTNRRQLETHLREAQKLDAIGQLAAGVAHDFNNLLTVVSAHAEIIRLRVQDRPEIAEALEMIDRAIAQAAGVTRSLMTFSCRLPTDKQPVEVGQEVRQTIKLLERTLPRNIELRLDVPDKSSDWVYANPTEVQQVVLNLALNARDAMPEGGVLRIRLADPGDDARNGDVRLIVADTGKGMTPDVRDRIFEPFFTTKRRGRSTGLGLAVVHGIVLSLGGRINVDSEPGRGSTFTITLPRTAPPAVVAAPHAAGGLIVLADGRAHVREIMAGTLAARGYNVVQAADAAALFESVQPQSANASLLIVAADLPGRPGVECLTELRSRGVETPAIVVTSQEGVELPQGLNGHVTLLRKPFQMDRLSDLVNECLTEAKECHT